MPHAAARAAAAILLVWLASVTLWLTPGIIIPDGAGYFVYLPSAILDRDLVFFDDWARIGAVRDGTFLFKEVTRTDHLANHWPVGSALTWAPGFLLGHLLLPITGSSPGGWSLPYNVAAACMSALAGLGVLLGCFRVVAQWTSSGRAAAAVIAGWLGTNLLWYSLVNSLTAHAVSAFLATALVLVSLRLRASFQPSLILLAGAVGGMACSVRPQNLVLTLVPLLILWKVRDRTDLLRGAPWYALGGLIGAAPQLLVSQVLYGSPLGFTYLGSDSAGTPFASFARIWWWEPLFSWYHGLFTWTPLALIGIGGIAALWKRDRGLAMSASWIFVSFWLINATMERSFWGGFAFGQRKFDALIPFLILGVGALAAVRPRLTAFFLVPSVVWTVALMLASRSSLDLNQYQTGGELAAAAAAAVASVGNNLAPLGAVPESARLQVAFIAGVTLLCAGLLVLFLRKLSLRWKAGLAVGYLLFCSFWIAGVSRRDAATIARWRPFLEENRGRLSAGAIGMRIDLLAREAAYLEKSGRPTELQETLGELERLRHGDHSGSGR